MYSASARSRWRLFLQAPDRRTHEQVDLPLHDSGEIVPALFFQKMSNVHQRIVSLQLVPRQQSAHLNARVAHGAVTSFQMRALRNTSGTPPIMNK